MKNLILTVLTFAFTLTLHSQIIYVTPLGAGIKDGSSWINALDGNSPSGNGLTKLADSMRIAASGKQFWIAEGTYKACTDNDREKSFDLGQNIKLFGGFQGTESDTNQRNIELHPTIFSGDIGVLDDSTDNTKIILKTISVPWINYSFIDGIDFFNSFNNLSNAIGTGIYNTGLISVKNCDFKNNYTAGYGAGIYNARTLKVEKCLFYNNKAYSGGGIYNNWTNGYYPVPDAIIKSSKFSNNISSSGGGGIRNCGAIKIINSLLINNSSITHANGGGIYAMSSTGGSSVNTRIYNSTMANNSGNNVVIWGGKTTILNSIIWGNGLSLQNNPISDIRYSNIQGYSGNQLVFSSDPLFFNATAGSGTGYNGMQGNWSLRWCSPCIDTGADTLVPTGIMADIDGNPRFRYASVDMGAYEYDTTGIINNTIGFANNRIYITDGTIYEGNGSSWATALAGNAESCKYPGQSLLFEAMKDAVAGSELWIRNGTYKNSLTGNRNHSFTVGNGVKVYGGFLGDETLLSQRNLQINKSTFSGNIGDLLSNADNSIQVMNINPTSLVYSDSCLLDGVTVENGYANSSDGAGILINSNTKIVCNNLEVKNNASTGSGAGLKINTQARVSLNNCLVSTNTGNGIYNLGKLNINYCTIKLNTNTGIYSADSLLMMNCSIDSNSNSGLINAQYCKITGGSLQGNKTTTQGGGIWNKPGSSLFLNNCTVLGNAYNTSNASGGGISNNGSLVITGSTINYNSVNGSGSGIYNSVSATCSVSHSTIAYNGGGGAVNSGIFTIEGSSICNNITSGYGGGLNNPTLVKSCIVANNTKSSIYRSGGGIWIGSACQGIFNTTVANNSGEGISSSTVNGWGGLIINPEIFLVKNSIVYGNVTQLSGNFNISNTCAAGIQESNSNIFDNPQWINPSTGIGSAFDGLLADWSLKNCSPCVNTGSNTFLLASDTLDAEGNVRVMYGTVDMGGVESQVPPVNDIIYNGGIVYINDSVAATGDGTSWSSSVSGNAPSCKYMGYNMLYQAMRDAPVGYQIWLKGGLYKVSNDYDRNKSYLIEPSLQMFGGFTGNENTLSERDPSSNPTILSGNIGNITDSLDNSYHVMNSLASTNLWSDTALLDNITILDGIANGPGENICGGGVFLNTNCMLKMNYCKINSNSCVGSGNPNIGIYNGGGGIMNKGILMMEDCNVSKNTAVYLGGGIFSNCDISLKNCLIDSNKITASTSSGWFWQWGGGGIYNYTTGKMTIDSCEIKNNATPINLHAGGIYNKGKLELQRSTIESNFAGRDGGGMYSMGTTIINHCHFTTNQSAYFGGAIVATDTLKIDSCLFDYNKGGSQPNIVTSGVSTISNSELSHNIVTNQSGSAGGLYSNGKTKVINCNIHSHDTHGIQMINTGGMFNFVIIFTGSDGGGIQHQGDTLWVDNCNIHHNISGGGGGIAVHSGVAYIKNSKLVNNFTAVGAAIRNKTKVYVSNSLFANNWYYNGGLFQNVSNSYMEIESSTISNNRQISTSNGNALLYHGEFQNPLANQFQLNNCIIETQSALTGYYPGTSGSDFISYSAVTGGFPGAGNINSNPLFVGPTTDTDTSNNALQADWTLSSCSPCVNAGNDAFVNDSLDLGGNIRKFNQVDMGAFELEYLNTITSVNASQIGRTKALIAWETSVLPCRTAVFVKDTIAGQPPIADVGLYSANTLLGAGSQLDGWSCIFNGTVDSVAISGLSEGITYRIAVFNFVLNQFYDVPGLQNFTTEKTELADITKTYGDSTFLVQAYSASGITDHDYIINYDSIAAVINSTITVSGAGTAVIKARHNGNASYLPDSTECLLTVNKAILDAIAEDKMKTYGEINPPLTVSYTGFAGADDESVIDTLVYALTDATSNSNAGTYIISTLGGFDNNYSFNRMNGVLIINKLIREISSTTSICDGDSLAVGNHVYTTSGVYLDTIVSTNIDTIFTTYLTVNPKYSFTENHSICSGETYMWQGTDYTVAGTFTAYYSTINGCDSIYTLNLIVNPVYSFPENHSICSGQTYAWQGTDYTTAGIFSANYSTINGCDSIYTLNLSVNPVYAFTETHSICSGETYTWQGTDYTAAGVFTANYSTINGCDSIYTLNLSVNSVYAFTENHSICSGETYTWQGTDYTTAGIFTANYSTTNGCDSIYTLNLTLNPVYSFTENHSICSGETYTWQGTDYIAAGTFTANYSTINGCDSIYTLNLIVNPVYSFTENHSICSGETYTWQGADYTSTGIFTANYSTINGCDSSFFLSLTVNIVNTEVTLSGITLTANSIADSYQWVNCGSGFAPIEGETNQSFTAPANGNYAVIVTEGMCSDTSVCVAITTVGIEYIQGLEKLRVYPNPAVDVLIVELEGNPKIMNFMIYNAIGEVVFKNSMVERTAVNTVNFAPGIYLIKLENGKAIEFVKMANR